MEALWNLEDKWKLSTREAAIVFVCTAFAVFGLCTAVVLKRRGQRKKVTSNQEEIENGSSVYKKWSEPSWHWVSVKRMLLGSVRWCGANKLGERSFRGWGERPPTPLLGLEGYECGLGWQSHNSDSPVWQRPILMGEKCELPRFSGVILYDERGRLLDHSIKDSSNKENNLHIQGKSATSTVRTMLKDLLSSDFPF